MTFLYAILVGLKLHISLFLLYFLLLFSSAIVAQLKAIRLGAPWRLSLNLTDVFHLSKVKEPANHLTKSKTNNQQTNKNHTNKQN